MLYREIIAVCSEIHTKHINMLCGQNVEFVNVKLGFRGLTLSLILLQTVATGRQLQDRLLHRPQAASRSPIGIKSQ